MVIRGPGGVGRQLGAEHSQRLESYFQSIPGVQLVACSTVANAKALLKSAIRSDNPIIFFEHVLLYNVKGARTPRLWPAVTGAPCAPVAGSPAMFCVRSAGDRRFRPFVWKRKLWMPACLICAAPSQKQDK